MGRQQVGGATDGNCYSKLGGHHLDVTKDVKSSPWIFQVILPNVWQRSVCTPGQKMTHHFVPAPECKSLKLMLRETAQWRRLWVFCTNDLLWNAPKFTPKIGNHWNRKKEVKRLKWAVHCIYLLVGWWWDPYTGVILYPTWRIIAPTKQLGSPPYKRFHPCWGFPDEVLGATGRGASA